MRLLARIVLLCSLGCSVACAERAGTRAVGEKLIAQQAYSGLQCGAQNDRPSAKWIGNVADLRETHKRFHANILGAELPKPPVVDFANEGVLLVSMGRKPTAGYGIALMDEKATVRGDAAMVGVSWEEPGPGSFQAQVLTSPCILVKMQKGPYSRVRVIDQNGKLRGEALVAGNGG